MLGKSDKKFILLIYDSTYKTYESEAIYIDRKQNRVSWEVMELRDYNDAPGNFEGMNIFSILIVILVLHIYVSKLIKLYLLNM